RLAVYEMTRGGTPAPVSIDEALELARRFSNEESVQFVNGGLDAIHRSMARGGGRRALISTRGRGDTEGSRRRGTSIHHRDAEAPSLRKSKPENPEGQRARSVCWPATRS